MAHVSSIPCDRPTLIQGSTWISTTFLVNLVGFSIYSPPLAPSHLPTQGTHRINNRQPLAGYEVFHAAMHHAYASLALALQKWSLCYF